MTVLESVLSPELQQKLAANKLTLAELTKALARTETAEPVATVPLSAVITNAQRSALRDLESVYGDVAPTEARALKEPEVSSLIQERLTLDEISTMIEKRKGDIRTIVLNHIDATVEDEAPRDKEGHKLAAKTVGAADQEKLFSWEISNRGGTLEADALQQLDEAGEIDHNDYLAMTDQVRMVNEFKVMALLKKKPELINKLGPAVSKKSQVGSLYVRKAK